MPEEESVVYSFVYDENIIGKWDSIDFVRYVDDFNPNADSFFESLYLLFLDVLPDGKILIKIEEQDLIESAFLWSYGYFYNQIDQIYSNYIIKSIDGEDYLFLEWKNGDYLYRNMAPWFYVFKKRKEVQE